MESLYKRKKLDYTSSVKECTSCTYTQNIFPIDTNGRIKDAVPTPPLLIQNKHLKRSSSDNDKNEVSPHYHFPHGINHVTDHKNHFTHDINHVSRDMNNVSRDMNNVSRERTYMSDKIATKSPPKKKLWSTDMPISEPPLLIKSCSVEHTRPSEIHHRKDKLPQKCITQGSLTDKYRHPIFATTEDFKKEVLVSGNKWDKHLKPYGLDHTQYMQCVSSKKNGGYLNTYCSKNMLNKNIYIDCGRPVEILNGDKDGYKIRNSDKTQLEEMHHDNLYSLGRQHSAEGTNSLLSTTSLKSQSIISVSSREESPPEQHKDTDNVKTRQSSMPQPMSLINFQILEKHEQYIVVYAEINGKRYEGCLGIERKPT